MNLGVFGAALVLGISAIGSAIGIGIAGQASIGAWKKCYLSNKAAPFILTVFAGAPLTQTIYGFLLMQQMKSSSADPTFLLSLESPPALPLRSLPSYRARLAPQARDALSETGKGFSQYITVVGLCETVALFVLVFSMGSAGLIPYPLSGCFRSFKNPAKQHALQDFSFQTTIRIAQAAYMHSGRQCIGRKYCCPPCFVSAHHTERAKKCCTIPSQASLSVLGPFSGSAYGPVSSVLLLHSQILPVPSSCPLVIARTTTV